VNRVVDRFEFHTGEAKLPSFDERGLVFRSLIEVGEEAFKAARSAPRLHRTNL